MLDRSTSLAYFRSARRLSAPFGESPRYCLVTKTNVSLFIRLEGGNEYREGGQEKEIDLLSQQLQSVTLS